MQQQPAVPAAMRGGEIPAHENKHAPGRPTRGAVLAQSPVPAGAAILRAMQTPSPCAGRDAGLGLRPVGTEPACRAGRLASAAGGGRIPDTRAPTSRTGAPSSSPWLVAAPCAASTRARHPQPFRRHLAPGVRPHRHGRLQHAPATAARRHAELDLFGVGPQLVPAELGRRGASAHFKLRDPVHRLPPHRFDGGTASAELAREFVVTGAGSVLVARADLGETGPAATSTRWMRATGAPGIPGHGLGLSLRQRRHARARGPPPSSTPCRARPIAPARCSHRATT